MCDDGDAGIVIIGGDDAGQPSCPYGAPGGKCTACTADCQTLLSLTGPYCGDGKTDGGGEKCDDGNADKCGTCSADCKEVQIGPAKGTISAVHSNQLQNGEQFTLNDGYTSIVFEFLKGGSSKPDSGVVSVAVSGDENAVAISIYAAINGVSDGGLNITATYTGQVVSLANTKIGSIGNQPITKTVSALGFIVNGMSGGGGFDCPADAGCTSDQDCNPLLTCQDQGDSGFMICR